MSWTSTYWNQDDNLNGGYPYSRYGGVAQKFNTSYSLALFVITDGDFYGYPYAAFSSFSTPFYFQKTFQLLTMDEDVFEDNVCGFNLEPFQLGAFRSCLNVLALDIPVTVISIGKYAFKDSGIEDVWLSPDCTFYDTTFPQTTNLHYYTVSNFIIVSEPTKKTYVVGETFDETGLEMTATITDKKGFHITRNILHNYEIEGIDTSVAGEYHPYVEFNGNSYPFSDTYVVEELVEETT